LSESLCPSSVADSNELLDVVLTLAFRL